MCCTPKEHLNILLYPCRNLGDIWESILRVSRNNGRKTKLDWAEFIDMGPLSRDSAFNIRAWKDRKGFNRLCSWLDQLHNGPQDGPRSDLEMPDLSWFNAEEEIQGLGRWNITVDLLLKTNSSILWGSRRHAFEQF